MPFFSSSTSSSRFGFKKSSPSRRQRRQTNKRSPVSTKNRSGTIQNDSEDSSTTDGSSIENETITTTNNKSSKIKKLNKRINNDNNQKSKSNQDGGLVLNIGDCKNHRFRFDPKHGIWKCLGKCQTIENSSSSLVIKPSVKENNDDANDHNGEQSNSNISELIESMKNLQEENRLLKLKIEILIEMVTETTAELNLKNDNNNGMVAKRSGSSSSSQT